MGSVFVPGDAWVVRAVVQRRVARAPALAGRAAVLGRAGGAGPDQCLIITR